MYNEYFGFKESPFSITPDAEFFYQNAACQNVLACLEESIRTGSGFAAITGEPGTGKTTLLHRLMSNLGDSVDCRLLINPCLTVVDFLRSLVKHLGLPDASRNAQNLSEQLQSHLHQRLAEGRTVALLFDEAQGLGDEALEELRRLYDGTKVSIVLAAQPQLDSRLNQWKLRPVKERMVVRRRLLPLEDDDVYPYLISRLECAGYRGADLFARGAVEKLIGYSSGIPRLINIICDDALLLAYRGSERTVTAAMIDEVAHRLRLVERPPRISESMMLPTDSDGSTDFSVLRRQTDAVAEPFGVTNQVSSESPDEPLTSDETVPADPPAIQPAAGALEADDQDRWTPALDESDQTHVPVVEQTALPEDDRAGNFEEFSASESDVGDFDDNEKNDQDPCLPLDVETKTVPRPTDPRAKISKLGLPVGAALAVLITVAWGWIGFYSRDAQEARPAANSRVENPPSEVGKLILPAEPIAVTSSVSQETPQPSITPQVSVAVQEEKDQDHSQAPVEQEDVKSADVVERNHPPAQEVYRVSGPSFLRNRPTADAEIIDTLQPGTRIAVTGKGGEYFRVRSLSDAKISGFVHREDAFFERVQ